MTMMDTQASMPNKASEMDIDLARMVGKRKLINKRNYHKLVISLSLDKIWTGIGLTNLNGVSLNRLEFELVEPTGEIFAIINPSYD